MRLRKAMLCVASTLCLCLCFSIASAMTITVDLENASNEELFFILGLINQKLEERGVGSPSESIGISSTPAETAQPAKQTVSVPKLSNISLEEAKTILQTKGILYKTSDLYSYTVDEGIVVRTSPSGGASIDPDEIVTVYVSKGPQTISSTNCTWYAWWINDSNGDNYEFVGMPYIEDDTLYVTLEATLNSISPHKWRGYGTAAINDTFDKVVPFELLYENEEIKKGETQEITLVIPLQDLNVKKPTTISVKIEMYYGVKNREESLRMDFTFAW